MPIDDDELRRALRDIHTDIAGACAELVVGGTVVPLRLSLALDAVNRLLERVTPTPARDRHTLKGG